ncbi:hypothetical protein [Halobacillus sp. A5]|uniref:hypothetical protein n=1 Tax=Halobacillus sp. A5 TaxID=2880263 RepID=UPI0020A6BA50|nr:hypothetical protein [Halobacillus sp. A5]MCP3027536.1 hypothetical protein [Halobacillus sp. A5]
MNKKIIAFTLVYAVIMAALLFITLNYNWNPSGYSYESDGSTVVIKEGLGQNEAAELDIAENMSEILLLQTAIQNVESHWQVDLVVISLFFPLILFSVFKETQPFKEQLPHNWFVWITIGIIAIYAVATVPSYIGEIQSVHERVNALIK